MPAEQSNVNLLEHDDFEESPIGRIVTWATSYGRYIMISTEIVVLLAFISRFSLDRKRADLNDAIDSKKAIIEANMDFEKEIRNVQTELARIKTLTSEQSKPLETLSLMKTLLPADVNFQSYDFANNKLTVRATSGTNQGFMLFINNLQSIKQFYRIDVGEIKKDPTTGILFQFAISLAPEKQSTNTDKTDNTKTTKENL
jgi:hypothetical protein